MWITGAEEGARSTPMVQSLDHCKAYIPNRLLGARSTKQSAGFSTDVNLQDVMIPGLKNVEFNAEISHSNLSLYTQKILSKTKPYL